MAQLLASGFPVADCPPKSTSVLLWVQSGSMKGLTTQDTRKASGHSLPDSTLKIASDPLQGSQVRWARLFFLGSHCPAFYPSLRSLPGSCFFPCPVLQPPGDSVSPRQSAVPLGLS